MKKDMIILMGGQGVGKGTFSKMLRDVAEFNYIETGALLRALPADSDIAKTVARGELVSDDMLFELMESQITDDQDILLDGFPRTLPQAQWLITKYADRFHIHVVYLDVPEDVMIARIQKRQRDGGGRADDADAAAVRRRLDTFWHVTMPSIEWLRTAPDIEFADVDVTGDLDTNFARIRSVLKI